MLIARVRQDGSPKCLRAPEPCGLAMTLVEMHPIVTTSTTLTSGAHTTHMVKNPTCFTRAVAVSVLIMGWNCRPTFTEITLRTNQANMKMPVTSRSTVPAVLHGIRCRVHHGLSTVPSLRIGAIQCTTGANYHGALWEAIAQVE